MRIRSGIAAAATTVLALTAACTSGSDDDGDGDSKPSASPSASESTEESPTDAPTEATGDPTGDGEMTAPGTQLKYGETATLEIKGSGVIELTVLRIDRAKPADLRGESVDLAADTVHYIRSRVTIVSHAKDGMVSTGDVAPDFGGVTKTGFAGPLASSTLEQCQYPVEPRLPEPGDSFETCNPITVRKGEALVGAQYSRSDSPYNIWDGKPIVWRP
ncbi:hypothetical protein [Nocardioides speluncae]|uniref:hypothetical protein n=1 Tax=Nocardioides speluncae TaxID=2670337 RepID=UPI000D69DD30|nr:hypothetical protein [Nocardioides speluncae]